MDWYRLDNAAKIYPAISNRSWNAIFRLAAVLTEEIEPEILKQAVADLRDRFPSFFVQLRFGVFWYYFESTRDTDVVELEHDYPCRPMLVGEGDKPLFRVLYYSRRISVEFFHSITDGTGGMIFLKTLIGRYLELRGYAVSKTNGVLDHRDLPDPLELEDSFQRVYDPALSSPRHEQKAYKYNPADISVDFLKITHGIADLSSLRALAKENGGTINEYLCALYAFSIYKNCPQRPHTRPIRISVPINLRPLFGSTSLRNFALYANVTVDVKRGDLTFQEIFSTVCEQLRRDFDPELLRRAVSANVGSEKNRLMRMTPLFIKNIALRFAYTKWGDVRNTSTLSNLGYIKLPEDMEPYVERFDFILNSSIDNAIKLAVVGYKNHINISFSSASRMVHIQRAFFSELVKNGVEVCVETNVTEMI